MPVGHAAQAKQVRLVDALEAWATSTQHNLLYRPEIVPDIQVSCTEPHPEAHLRCLVAAANLDFYQTAAGSFVLTELPKSAISLQGTATGVVTDAITKEPLPFANIFLPALKQGTTTNENGVFAFEALPLGEERVEISYLGYRTHTSLLTVAAPSVTHGIALQPKVVSANPVVVSGLQRFSHHLGQGATKTEAVSPSGIYGTHDVLLQAQTVMGVSTRLPTTDLHIQGGEANEHQLQLDGIPIFNPVSLGRVLGAFSPLAIGKMKVHKSGFRASEGSQISGIVRVEHDIWEPSREQVRLQADPVSLNGRIRLDYTLPFNMKAATMVAFRSSLWDIHQASTLSGVLTQWNSVDPLLSSVVLGLTAPYLQYQSEWQNSNVGFQDIHVASALFIKPQHKVLFSGYYGTNALNTEFWGNEPTYINRASSLVEINNVKRELLGLEPAFVDENKRRYMLTRDQYGWSNRGGQVRYDGVWGNRAWTAFQVRHSRYALTHAYKMTDKIVDQTTFGRANTKLMHQQLQLILDIERGAEDDNQNAELAIEGDVHVAVSDNHFIEAGFEVARASNHFRIDSLFFNPVSLSSDQWRIGGYWQETFRLDAVTTVEVGMRFTGVPDRKKTYLEPRLAIRYDLRQTPVGEAAWRVAGGIYRQFMSPFDISNVGPSATVPTIRFWLPIDQSVAPPTAYHLASEVSLAPHPYWQVHAEAYYKWQPRILSVDYAALFDPASDPLQGTAQAEFITETDGFVGGGGIHVQYEQGGVQLALAYSRMHAERRYPGRFSNEREPTPWNEPHRLTFSAEIRAMEGLSFRLRTLGIWGRSWGFRQAYYDYFAAHAPLTDFQPFDLADPSAHRLPPLRQLDVGVSYEYEVDGMTILIQADFINALNRINVVDWSLERADDNADYPFLGGWQTYQKVERTLNGFMPVLSASIGF